MKEQFADYQTSKMLKELGFDEKCMQIQHPNLEKISFSEARLCNSDLPSDVIAIPNWHQIKEWLWQKYKIYISVDANFYTAGVKFESIPSSATMGRNFFGGDTYDHNSPITAEIEGEKLVVKYLHKQITK